MGETTNNNNSSDLSVSQTAKKKKNFDLQRVATF